MTDEPGFDELEAAEGSAGDDEDDEDVWEPVRSEPDGATRNSPYAIAAMVTAVLSAWPLAQGFLNIGYFPAFEPLRVETIVRIVAGALPTFAIAAAAYWLAGRADEEIYVSEGRLGGVGLVLGARVIAAIAVVGLVGLTTLNMTLRDDPNELNFGPDEIEMEDDTDGVVEFLTPPPDAPARPAEPAP